ncbi:carbohydrate-binding protein [Citrobacter rodentium]|uniref:chitinase n=2 Tax=Citrobacter rodentium TaxID=67825 RepID=D2TMG2_CITRI|nr:carbohydrate-binding protein [Citrobacter rodentium]UHO33389.1 lysozyme [Citrobacter rodentium NBRC 105723 = DSM 16636]CBG91176.1 putative polysaccharide degrading enzyme [Citrobacter rodentium ICC168]KIQ52481.1 lysozyme [Citrobacter rodentium]QBY30748.1 lysozyme [Citrobacter rodentium]HAT8015850.1 lysozyme [Citrobacter rodentium NBRC 105723 = DSM 16636]
MKLNLATKALFCMGLTCAALPAFALEAWSGQEGGSTYEVIFDGGVYTNAWWVGASDCPGNAADNEANNPWRYERAATAAEMDKYGNPTTCETSGGTVTYPAYDNTVSYNAGDIVSYNNATYKTSTAQSSYGFAPGQENPWEAYAPVAEWSSSTVYNKGDKVQKNGEEYEAMFYTVGNDPSVPANQNPTGTNGRPWKPLGAVVSYTQEQLNNAPEYNASTLYESGTLIRYNGANYVSQAKVQKVSPTDTNPWRIFIDWTGTKEKVGTPKSPWPAHVYAPYVDFTLNSQPDLASLAQNQNVTHFTMAFVVSKDAETCLPTWGTAYNINDYAQYSKIKALREAGGDVMVSIGGANNAPLAASCKNVQDLKQHYYDIVDNLNLNVLDFDIEGTWVADHESINRRNEAVKAVQDTWKEEGRKIGIWYTLPILPTGLTAEGLYVLEDAKAKGVDLAGVNVMTMDYGNSICQSDGTEGQNIHGKCATSAIENMHSQLKQIFTDKSDAEINAMMGTTPMIGYNDVQGEVFYMSDAKLVMQDATERGLGMIGIWSMMRDQPGVAKQVSPEHSGLTAQQAPQYAFSEVFAPFTQAGDSGDLTGDVKAVFVDVFDGKQRINVNFDASKLSGSNSYRVEVDGQYVFSTEGGKSYYGYRYNYGTQSTIRTGDVSYLLHAGSVVTVKRTGPDEQILATLTVTEDMLKGNNPLVSSTDVTSLSVKKEKGIPMVYVGFAADKIASGTDSSYVIKVMGDAKNGNYVFSYDNGKCYYSSKSTSNGITTVKSDERAISAGETIVVERITPSPATIAKIVVTEDMLK